MINRIIPPSIHPIKTAKQILPQRIKINPDNDLFLLDESVEETVKIDFIWEAGIKFENKKIESTLTNALIFSGTNELNSKEIADKIDSYGGYVNQTINKDQAGFTVFGLQKHIDNILEIVFNSFNKVQFNNDEIGKLITIQKKQFEISLEKVSTHARQLFLSDIFGESHPYGSKVELKDFNKIKQQDLIDFFKINYRIKKPNMFYVGKLKDTTKQIISSWTAQFKHSNVVIDFPEIINAKPTKEHFEKDGAIQTAIRVGRIAINRSHTDYFKFQVLNTVLGGYFGSRLMANIREDKGYTYGIGSGISVLDNGAYFFISTEVAKEVKDETIKEIYIEINKLKSELIPESELTKVKSYMLGQFLNNSDGTMAMMENFKNIYFNNLSEEYYTDFINAINDCTAKQLMEMANKYFIESEFTEISYG